MRFYLPLLIFLIPAITYGFTRLNINLQKGLCVLAILALLIYPIRVPELTQEMPQAEQELIEFLEKNTNNEHRIAIEVAGKQTEAANVHLDHFLPLYLDRQFIGGPFPYFYAKQGYANFVDGKLITKQIKQMHQGDFNKITQDFNIGWIITKRQGTKDALASQPVTYLTSFGQYSVYEVDKKDAFTLDKTAKVQTEKNKIIVTEAKAKETILKYHYLETLQTQEGFEVKPHDMGYPVPFISVENKGKDFTIINGY